MGGFPTGVLVSRWILGRDIREFGSGNPGAMNIWRIFGLRWGLIVVVIDVGKGWIAARYAPQIADVTDLAGLSAMCGMLAVIGHIWSPFTRFRGGKGIGAAWGAGLALHPVSALLCLTIWLGLIITTRYASVASLTAAVCWPAALWWRENLDKTELVLSLLLPALLIYSHRANLHRLLKGCELKVGRAGH